MQKYVINSRNFSERGHMRYIIAFIISFLVGFVAVKAFRLLVPKPVISVVMATYNRADLLPRAVNSVLNQSFKDFEFIIVIDGSTDETANILKSYASKDKRIRVLENDKNRGLIYSLNRALDAARGKYIARMDDDDISLPERFAYQVGFMEKNPRVTVVSSWVSAPGSMVPFPFQQEIDPDKIKILPYLNTVPISHPAAFIRRDFIEQNHIRYRDNYKYIEDRAFWRDIFDAGGIISNIPKVLLQYRSHFQNPKEYYTRQYYGTISFHREMMERLIGKDAYSETPNCEKFVKMAAANKEKKLLHQQKFEQLIELRCPDVKF